MAETKCWGAQKVIRIIQPYFHSVGKYSFWAAKCKKEKKKRRKRKGKRVVQKQVLKGIEECLFD
jgi:hypothetical protein